jgi:hypothetical protein
MEEDAPTCDGRAVEALQQRDPSAAAGEGQGGDAAARSSPGDDDIEVHGESQLGHRRPRAVRLERDVANERCRTVSNERVGWCPPGWSAAAAERNEC